ncbi:glycosyltransferase family 2 protein [Bacillus sp. JJ1562]|uniref:glycosyltransferase family 2 protein n=1 Tax=Bacillus sp. JJ1562 TaxID=3122960 RepID=UPI0030028B4C
MNEYEIWQKYNALTELKREEMKAKLNNFTYSPLFTIITSVQDGNLEHIKKCIASVKNQIYPLFEWIIAAPWGSKGIGKDLQDLTTDDSRININSLWNHSIPAGKNRSLQVARGEFIVLLDLEDEIQEDALFQVAALLNKQPEADMIYCDEDVISSDGQRFRPFFKPDWSPDTFLTYPFVQDFVVFRTSLIKVLGGFEKRYIGVENQELILRLSENTKHIYHIPQVLYHKREKATNDNSFIGRKYMKAINKALERKGESATVTVSPHSENHFPITYHPVGNPLISIIIPTRDYAQVLERCLESIFNKTTYTNFEIIIIDNGSTEEETITLFKKWKTLYPNKIKIERIDEPYNWSYLNNEAALIANGELLLFLNNDVEVISPNWLEEMAGQALRSQIGAVGAKLLYFDDTIQHAGVVLGVQGLCDHCYKGKDSEYPGYFGRLLGPSNFSAVTGACLMVRKSLFEEVSGLDEELAIEFNDVDLCISLYKHGYYNILLPQVVLYHHESKSRGIARSPERIERSKVEAGILRERWRNYINNDPFYNENLELSNGDFAIALKLNEAIKMSEFVKEVIEENAIKGRMNGKLQDIQIELFGWAINENDPDKRMEIIVANQEDYVIAHTKIDRKRVDIAEKFNNQQFLIAGWRTVTSQNLLPKGEHLLTGYVFFPTEGLAVKLNGSFEILL